MLIGFPPIKYSSLLKNIRSNNKNSENKNEPAFHTALRKIKNRKILYNIL